MPVHTKKERKLKGIKKSSSGKIRKLQKGGKASTSQTRGLKELRSQAEQTRPSGFSRDLVTHFDTVQQVTEALAGIVGPDVAGVLMRGASFAGEVGDEAASFIPSSIAPGLSRAGFDEQDLVANELGIQAAQEAVRSPQRVPVPERQDGGQIPQIAGVRVPTEDAMSPPGLQTGGLIGGFQPPQGLPPGATPPQRNEFGFAANAQGLTTPQAAAGNRGTGSRVVSGFDPLSGQLGQQAQGTLGSLLQTGLPTDTEAIKASARQQAEQGFQQQTGQINEQVGALGLGSSSARAREIGQASAGLQANLAGQGAQLDFGASEAAKGRQLQAFSPFLGATGQTLQGNIAQSGLTGAFDINKANIAAGQRQQTTGLNAAQRAQRTQQQFEAARQNAQQRFQSRFQRGGTVRFPLLANQFIVPSRGDKDKSFDRQVAERKRQESRGRLESQRASRLQQGRERGAKFERAGAERTQQRFENERLQALKRATAPGPAQVQGPRFSPFGPVGFTSDPNNPGALAQSFFQRLNAAGATGGRAQFGGVAPGGGSRFGGIGSRSTNLAAPSGSRESRLIPMRRREDGGKVPGSSAGGDTVPAEVGQPDGQPDVMLQGQEGIVPLDIMNELQHFTGDPGQAVGIVNTLRDIMGQAPGPRGPEENGGDTSHRQVGGSFTHGGPIPTNQQRVGQFGPGVSPQFDPNIQGDVGFDQGTFSLTGDPNTPLQNTSGISVGGVDQSSELAGDQLQAAQLRRRAAFFDELIATSPQAATERLTARRDDALAQAGQFEVLADAELNRQNVLSQQAIESAGRVQEAEAIGPRAGSGQGIVTPQQLRSAITGASDEFIQLSQTNPAALQGRTREEHIDSRLQEIGLGQFSPFQGAVGTGAQQAAIGRIQERDVPGANPEGPLFGQEVRRRGRAAQEVPGVLGSAAVGAETALAQGAIDAAQIVDNLLGGIEENPREFEALLEGLGQGRLNPDELDQVIQLNQFLINQVDQFRAQGQAEQAGRAEEVANLISERLVALGIGPIGGRP